MTDDRIPEAILRGSPRVEQRGKVSARQQRAQNPVDQGKEILVVTDEDGQRPLMPAERVITTFAGLAEAVAVKATRRQASGTDDQHCALRSAHGRPRPHGRTPSGRVGRRVRRRAIRP